MTAFRACGSIAESYANDMALLRTPLQWLALAALIAALILYPHLVSSSWIRFATVSGITVITVVGLQLLMGIAGQVSIGQSAFMGIGAYCAAVAATTFQLPFPLPVLAGALGSLVVGVLFGLPAARIKGFYLALTTLAAQFVFQFSMVRLPADWFGQSAGIAVSRPVVFGITISSTLSFYYLAISFAVLMTLLALFIVRSRVGRAMVAIRDNDLAAEVTGIDVTRYKIIAFGLASFYAGVAGSLLAYENRLAHFEQFTLFESIWYLGMLIVGGLGSILGAVLGAISLRLVEELLIILGPSLAEMLPGTRYDIAFPMVNVVLGGLIIVFLIYQPHGLAHLYRRAERYARRWPFAY